MTIDQDMIMIHVPEVVPVISHVYVHDGQLEQSVLGSLSLWQYTQHYTKYHTLQASCTCMYDAIISLLGFGHCLSWGHSWGHAQGHGWSPPNSQTWQPDSWKWALKRKLRLELYSCHCIVKESAWKPLENVDFVVHNKWCILWCFEITKIIRNLLTFAENQVTLNKRDIKVLSKHFSYLLQYFKCKEQSLYG